MGQCACATGTLQCSFGMAPSTFMVLPDKMILSENKPMANIMDNKPMVNIMPFGMCQSLANPTVAAATAAALGVTLSGSSNSSKPASASSGYVSSDHRLLAKLVHAEARERLVCLRRCPVFP